MSDVELAALCKCLNLNVVIFKRDVVSNETVYLRSSVIDVSVAPVLIALQVWPQFDSVRSHFERLTISGDGSAPNAVITKSPQAAGSANDSRSLTLPCGHKMDDLRQNCLTCRAHYDAREAQLRPGCPSQTIDKKAANTPLPVPSIQPTALSPKPCELDPHSASFNPIDALFEDMGLPHGKDNSAPLNAQTVDRTSASRKAANAPLPAPSTQPTACSPQAPELDPDDASVHPIDALLEDMVF